MSQNAKITNIVFGDQRVKSRSLVATALRKLHSSRPLTTRKVGYVERRDLAWQIRRPGRWRFNGNLAYARSTTCLARGIGTRAKQLLNTVNMNEVKCTKTNCFYGRMNLTCSTREIDRSHLQRGWHVTSRNSNMRACLVITLAGFLCENGRLQTANRISLSFSVHSVWRSWLQTVLHSGTAWRTFIRPITQATTHLQTVRKAEWWMMNAGLNRPRHYSTTAHDRSPTFINESVTKISSTHCVALFDKFHGLNKLTQ